MATRSPQWKIATDSAGKFQWRRNGEFWAWFLATAASATARTLQRLIQEKTGRTLSLAGIHNLRMQAGIQADPALSQEAYRERLHCEPSLQRLRLIGPEDEEYFLKVRGDCIITGDWHIPYHDHALLDSMLAVAKALGITQLIINGDFLNQDAFSKWRHHAFNIDWHAERDIARDLVRTLCKAFKTIYYILDNHDRRIIAANERPAQFTEDDVISLIADATHRKQLRASLYYHYTIVEDVNLRVSSPREYRRTKLALPDRIARLHQQHVIVGGDHLFGMGVDDSGRYVIGNGMAMVNPKEVPYKNVQDTTYPEWNQGFWVVWQKTLYPFSVHPMLWPRWWEKWKKA